MTAVTAISIYSDLGVICVIAVTVYQLDEPAFAGAFGAIHDAHWLQHVASELAEVYLVTMFEVTSCSPIAASSSVAVPTHLERLRIKSSTWNRNCGSSAL